MLECYSPTSQHESKIGGHWWISKKHTQSQRLQWAWKQRMVEVEAKTKNECNIKITNRCWPNKQTLMPFFLHNRTHTHMIRLLIVFTLQYTRIVCIINDPTCYHTVCVCLHHSASVAASCLRERRKKHTLRLQCCPKSQKDNNEFPSRTRRTNKQTNKQRQH